MSRNLPAILFLFTCLLASCTQAPLNEPSKRLIVAIFDDTGSYRPSLPRAFQVSDKLVEELRPGDSLVALRISSRSFTEESTILHVRVPVSNKPIDVAHEKALPELKEQWRAAVRASVEGRARRTEIFGSIASASLLLASANPDVRERLLFLFSDLQDNVGIRTTNEHVDLTGVNVRIVCVPKAGDPAAYAKKASLWTKNFQRWGAKDVRILSCDEAHIVEQILK